MIDTSQIYSHAPTSPARWHRHFLRIARECAGMSKDPSTQVGAVLVEPVSRAIVSTGFNGFPRRVKDTEARYLHRPTKMLYVVHAELNAVLNAARRGMATDGCVLYVSARSTADGAPSPWAGPPCPRCTVHLIQAGIRAIVSITRTENLRAKEQGPGTENPRAEATIPGDADLMVSEALLHEAGVEYLEVGEET